MDNDLKKLEMDLQSAAYALLSEAGKIPSDEEFARSMVVTSLKSPVKLLCCEIDHESGKLKIRLQMPQWLAEDMGIEIQAESEEAGGTRD